MIGMWLGTFRYNCSQGQLRGELIVSTLHGGCC